MCIVPEGTSLSTVIARGHPPSTFPVGPMPLLLMGVESWYFSAMSSSCKIHSTWYIYLSVPGTDGVVNKHKLDKLGPTTIDLSTRQDAPTNHILPR